MTQIFYGVATGALLAGKPKTRRINWLAEHLPNPEEQRDYARAKCVEAIAASLDRSLDAANLNRVALADKLGKSKGQITRILSGAHNMTLHTLGDVLWACDLEVMDFDRALGPLGVIEVSVEDESEWLGISATIYTPTRAPPTGGDQATVLTVSSFGGSSAFVTSQTLHGHH